MQNPRPRTTKHYHYVAYIFLAGDKLADFMHSAKWESLNAGLQTDLKRSPIYRSLSTSSSCVDKSFGRSAARKYTGITLLTCHLFRGTNSAADKLKVHAQDGLQAQTSAGEVCAFEAGQ
jgi:hypothetical protein